MTLAFWGSVALLLAGALLFVLPPMLRPPTRIQAGPSPLTVYREQRAQLDVEHAQGTLTTAQHTQALAELQGRVIDEVGVAEPPAPPANPRLPLAVVMAVALLLPGGALGLYAWLGTPAALAPETAAANERAPHTMSREQMADMVERLAGKLKNSPDDAEGWHMLARSYVAIGRLPDAAQAYDRAATLAPKNPQVLADYADTLAMVNGRNLEGRPTELVSAALKVDPAHPKSLSLAGTAAFNRGDFAAAVAAWRKLHSVLPPDSEQARSVATSIAQAQAAATKVPTPALARSQVSAPTGAASIEGSVTIAAALRSRLAPGTTLFVYARSVDGPRMPVAILRVSAGPFPYRFKLDDSSSMTPQNKLSGQREVLLGARISRNGNAMPESGDLMGTLSRVKVGSRGIKLVIDEVVRCGAGASSPPWPARAHGWPAAEKHARRRTRNAGPRCRCPISRAGQPPCSRPAGAGA
jgi:cytochrome c-type biogenesis protein CcmH